MAGQGHDMRHNPSHDFPNQGQLSRDDYISQPSHQASHGSLNHQGLDSSFQSSAHNNYELPNIAQSANSFLHQTGEQVKNMAQGAAEAVKTTLGMNPDNSNLNNPGTANRSNNPGAGVGAGTTNRSNNPSHPNSLI
ncbi:uncharacterized protein LOC131158502 [Malania oleifera]|uniref:uncharacterized protein LOC131158502 n=1 Tax=Malania oleifera TaxID=397392 RepID=UPI0025ADEA95|nr:uncharacterized protein LOC131158502 [Malania oleifera]